MRNTGFPQKDITIEFTGKINNPFGNMGKMKRPAEMKARPVGKPWHNFIKKQ
jgi:hypothetical protein